MRIVCAKALLIALCCGLSAPTLARERETPELAKAAEWEKAALHREWAASIADEEAQTALERAAILRRQAYTEEDERQAYYRRAGHLEKKAGDMLVRALSNLDAAETAWRNAAREYRRTSEQEKELRALSAAVHVQRRALDICGRVARAYERAADAFEPENGADSREALANRERAALWRQRVAERMP